MPNETLRMYLVAVASALLLISCTVPNPESCADGKCTDDRFPFCDEDGAVAGKPGACIAVACTANEFEVCRGDEAITCDTTGNNFDVTQCPLGCSANASGCKQCTGNEQCSGTAPICDLETNSCKQCVVDDDCLSRVCDPAGSCVSEDNVVYAAPAGAGTICNRTSPCSLIDAVSSALGATVTPTLRILPGTYAFPLDITFGSQQVFHIVGTGATLASSTAISIGNGANVDVRGLNTISSIGLHCATGSAKRSKIAWHTAVMTKIDNAGSLFQLENCEVTLSNAELSLGGGELVVTAMDDSSLSADRTFVHGSNTHYVSFYGVRSNLRFTNSLLVNVSLNIMTTDLGPPGSSVTMAYDTFVTLGQLSTGPGCGVAQANRTVRWENSIIGPLSGSGDSIDGPGCTLRSVLVTHQATPMLGVLVADPQFVDVAQNNFHLKSTSIAVDAGLPSEIGLAPSSDLDGHTRPQGVAPDLGAYELVH